MRKLVFGWAAVAIGFAAGFVVRGGRPPARPVPDSMLTDPIVIAHADNGTDDEQAHLVVPYVITRDGVRTEIGPRPEGTTIWVFTLARGRVRVFAGERPWPRVPGAPAARPEPVHVAPPTAVPAADPPPLPPPPPLIQ